MTGTAWIGLEQNIIDTDVNKWRKRLLACVRIAGQHNKQFYYRQLKNDNWMKCQPQCQKCEQNVFSRVMLNKQSHRWLCFPQVVQKQTLGEVGN